MENELTSNFDVIVLGTDPEPVGLLKEGEELSALSLPNSLYDGVKYQWHVPEEEEVSSETQNPDEGGATASDDAVQGSRNVTGEAKKNLGSKKSLVNCNRKFNIDLAPKILFSRGALVELLISSNVARYVEFKCITRVLTWVDEQNGGNPSGGKLVVVPCSRSDVFTTDVISLVEKRLLMKFLEFCYLHEKNKEEWADFADKPFKEFLESRDLTPKLIHFITSAIGMVDEEANTEEGLRKTSLFLNSLGRYGSMPFLFTLFGSGEMPQAFCRLCAVFEGIYMLRRSVEYVIIKEGMFCGIASEGERFTGEHLVMDCGL
ncbi:Rab proteins geranylgeranyltransferase component A 1 [Armadillidium nasatum]|uniref:Rab proteins geranylgeranyltransferase component A 1 n=1 Tax=Armadillidium nasatum TaxID=96803 RepID=A0A5N5T6X8_9CRUS|nr:Rab proteins geranylgeranyltransferase component A 1 [Armadillidium nasatum]